MIETYITVMVDETRNAAFVRSVHDIAGLVYSEQIAGPNSLSLVTPLPDIGDYFPNNFTNVLYHHFIRHYRFLCKEAPIVDIWPHEFHLFSSCL